MGGVGRLEPSSASRLVGDRPPCIWIYMCYPRERGPRLHLTTGCRPRTKPWEEMGCGRWSSCPRGSQSFWCPRFYRDISIRQLRASCSRNVEDGCDHLWSNQNSDDSNEQLHSRNHNLFYRSV